MSATAGWTSVRLDDVETLDEGELPLWKPLRHVLGVAAFGVNAWVAPRAGDLAIEEHDEGDADGGQPQEEVYFVASGRATFTVAGERVDAPAGTVLAVTDPTLRRGAVAEEDGTVVLAIGGARGEAFRPSDWEQRALASAGLR